MILMKAADNRLVTTYRGLHDLIGNGVPLVEIYGEMLGREMQEAAHGSASTASSSSGIATWRSSRPSTWSTTTRMDPTGPSTSDNHATQPTPCF
jgi:hypothetical protein